MSSVNDADARRLLAGKAIAKSLPGENVVISGLSGRFPNSLDANEFLANLRAKQNLCDDSERRYTHFHPELPKYLGVIDRAEYFDVGFFGVHRKHVDGMDAMARMMIEKTYEAIMDAGINPSELRGTKTGVFLGVCCIDSQNIHLFKKLEHGNFSAIGSSKTFSCEYISYFFGLNGPSMICDTACSSGLYAFEEAYRAIKEGKCDKAIVGGSNLLLQPYLTLQFVRLGVLNSVDGCKPFDENASGYTRSEGIVVLLLQKSKDAKRIYAEIVHSKTNADGFKSEGITYPSGEMQTLLLKNVYEECNVDPKNLAYIEAHGTGTKVGDLEELNSIDSFFKPTVENPLLIGSVKGNIGHGEAVSGLSSLVKVVFGMETGLIPPNIHYNIPRQDVKALVEKRLEVVTENTQWPEFSPLAGVNCFGFGGANCHVVLKRNLKKVEHKVDKIPRIICFCATSKEGVEELQNYFSNNIPNIEFIRLVQDSYRFNIQNNKYKGFTIISDKGELARSCMYYDEERKPLYLCIGNQNRHTKAVLQELTQLQVFNDTYNKIKNILKENQLDVEISLNQDENRIFEDLIVTACVQLGIINVLKEINIQPDLIIGSSFGEIISAYANNSLDLEEVLLLIFYISDALLKIPKLEHLYITLSNKLRGVLKPGVKNSGKHLRPECNTFGYATPEYFMYNILNPQTMPRLRDNSAVLLNVDYKFEKLGEGVDTITLSQKDLNLIDFLSGIGRLYQFGYEPQVYNMYPQIEWPVSRGTPMFAPFIKWNHKMPYFMPKFSTEENIEYGENSMTANIMNSDMMYLKGHVIDGRNLFPATGYLMHVVEVYRSLYKMDLEDLSLCFSNVKFHKATTFDKKGSIRLYIVLFKSGEFEISESDTTIVTGCIQRIDGFEAIISEEDEKDISTEVVLDKKDVYNELKLRGYQYSGLFRAIEEYSGAKGLIKWSNNWVTFLDNMLQLNILQENNRCLYVPTGIAKLTINGQKHAKYVENLREGECIPVFIDPHTRNVRTKYIEICGIQASSIARRKQILQPILETYKFIPNETHVTLEESFRINTQIILENKNLTTVNVAEYTENNTIFSHLLLNALNDLPLVQPEMKIYTDNDLNVETKLNIIKSKIPTDHNSLIFIGKDLSQNTEILSTAINTIIDDGFIISIETYVTPIFSKDFTILTKHAVEDKMIYLIRKTRNHIQRKAIDVSDQLNLDWLPLLQSTLKKTKDVIIYSQYNISNGILGLMNCLRREPSGDKVICFFLQDIAPKFDQNLPFYEEQITKGLNINVFKGGKWGTYRHLLIEDRNLVEKEHCFGNVTKIGDLSSLSWIEGPLKLKDSRNMIQVYISAINFRDLMTASGKVPIETISKNRIEQECIQGFEYAGLDERGNKVMGMVSSGAISTIVKADPSLVWTIPDIWSFKEAATVPVVYSTVLIALKNRAQIREHQSILIHSGTGGIGLAAINVATYYNLEIFVTVGTQEKFDFLRKHYPHIKESHIGNSRDISFEEMIYKETKGRGVDVVLNSLAEEKLLASVRCLATGGTFLEIGKFDLSKNSTLSTDLAERGITFTAIMLDKLFLVEGNITLKADLQKMLYEGIHKGFVKPLPINSFKMNELEKAFRYIGVGKHIGKVVIEVRNEECSINKNKFLAIPRYYFNPNASYIIIGGLGGFGLELADWMVVRGAKNLILSSRNGLSNGYQKSVISKWKDYDVNSLVCLEDITTIEGCKNIINLAGSVAPLDGIFNLAVNLKDGIFENLTEEDYEASLKPKAIATKYLDEVSRELCPNLKLFVVFSSVSCGRGNSGQTNYGLSNSVMERICEKRRFDGFSGLAIQWGAVGDVGLVAQLQKEAGEIAIGGTLQQRISSCLEVMDTFLGQEEVIVSSIIVAEKTNNAASDNLVDSVLNILGLRDLKTVSRHSTLPELGMDSMMGVEIKQVLERDFDIFLTAQDLKSLTIARLFELNDEKHSPTSLVEKENEEDLFNTLFNVLYDEKTCYLPYLNLYKHNNYKTTILLPGIEGVFSTMDSLAQNLKRNSITFQYTSNKSLDSLETITEKLWMMVEDMFTKDTSFEIIGYSLGTVFALELGKRLEKRGLQGKIAFIDAAPEFISELSNAIFKQNSVKEFDIELILFTIAPYVTKENLLMIKENVKKATNFREMQEIVMEYLPDNITASKEFLFDMGEYSRNMVMAGKKYIPKQEQLLKSEILLLKASTPTINYKDHDFGLSKYCDGEITIQEIVGNHKTIMESQLLFDALNEFLG